MADAAVSKKGILLVAHGSRRKESNEEVRQLADTLRAQAGERFHFIGCAFLELGEPSIPDGIEASIRAGVKEIVILPYFLSAGKHVVTDVPELVEGKRREHPDVKIEIAPYVGASPGMQALLLSLVGYTSHGRK